MAAFRWSKYLFIYQKDGLICYFNKLTADYLITDKYYHVKKGNIISNDEIASMGDTLFQSLRSKHLIISSMIDDDLLFSSIVGQRKKMSLEHINMLITNKCNLDCSYCQIEKNCTDHLNIMSEQIAQQALDCFFSNCSKENEITVNITGGEPLTNWRVVKFIIEYSLNKYHGKLRLVIFTNGVLLDNAISEFLAKHNVLVIVSLDGPEEWHNKYRYKGNKKGSYKESLKGYQTAQKIGCTCAISSVANTELINNISDYWDWVSALKPVSIGLNYPHLLLSNSIDKNSNHYDLNLYTEAVIFLHRKAKKQNIYFENFERFNKTVKNHCIRLRECQACGRGMTVRGDGYIGTCKSLLVSDIISFRPDQFNYKNNSTFQLWANRIPAENAKCIECDAITICGGGCAYDSYILYNGDISLFDLRLCSHNKRIFQEILSDLCDEEYLELSNYCELARTVGH